MHLAYFGHHKCACTWISDLMLNVGNDLGMRTLLTQLNVDHKAIDRCNDGEIDLLLSLTSPFEKVQQLDSFRGFHVIRDPRDICVSGYYSHLYSHSTDGWPQLAEHREKLKASSKSDGLIEEIEFSSYFIEHISTWDYSHPDILELKMETLTADPLTEFARIFEFLGIKAANSMSAYQRMRYKLMSSFNRVLNRLQYDQIKQEAVPPARMIELLRKQNFEKLAGGRKKGEENVRSHYRKGVPGDWKNSFEDRHKKYFKERYGELLVRLGYESDNSW